MNYTIEKRGKTVVVEKAVTFSDRVEFTVSLSSPPSPSGEEEGSETSFTPAAVLSAEQSTLPLAVVWTAGGR